ncbi:MAG: type II secretion system secretin GspD, partial [Acidobacteriota bacterium]|nr:type II secretion system secretin GspD [Acidobacteriota bacterium]
RKDPEAPIINMEEAKLYDIIKLLCDLMEVNYLIDPSVKDQTITISMTRSDQKLKTSDLLDLLLKLHDLTMVENGSFISIVPIESSEIYPGLNLLYGSRPNESLRREELIMQIVPLRYVSAADLSGVIRDFLSPSARVLEEQRNNVLIIIDKNHYIRKVLELIPIFDVDVLANKKMVFYELAHVDAVETGSKLEEILGVYGYESGSESLAIVPIETLNGLLVVSNSENIFKELDFWIEKFDQEAQFEEEQVFVYKVENTTADAISFTLSQLFGLRTSGGGGSRVNQGASSRRSTNPNSQFGSNRGGGLNNRNLNRNNPNDPSNRNNLNRNNPNDPNNRNLNRNNPSNRNLNNRNLNRTGANNLQGDGPLMIVDDDNNSLIFKTTHREYTRIFKTLKELDVLPRQVFLEVTVLSVRLTDTFALGLTWNATDTPGDSAPGGTSPISSVAGGFEGSDGGAPSFAGAYSYASSTALITASLSAAKSKGYVNVLQQPHIMAIDNQTASISVGTAIPIQTTRTNIGDIGDGTALNPASSSTIQYRDTGVSLAFTPHINANGVIRLEIDLDISSADDQSTSAEAVPISQNTLSTEMIVRDNQTVVMGGLIFDQEGWGRDSVPFLGRIPVLKHLFTNRNSSVTKSELIVMITPKLVDSEEKSLAISREFKDKILKEFDSFKGPGN